MLPELSKSPSRIHANPADTSNHVTADRAEREAQAKAKKSEPTTVDKAKDDAKSTGAAKEAKKGAEETKKSDKSGDAPDSSGAKIGAAIGGAAEKAVRDAADAGITVGKAVAKAAKPLVEPTVREIKEAGKEIGDAAKDYGKGWIHSLNPFHGVGDIWNNDDLSVGSKIGGTVGKVVENTVTDAAKNVGNAARLGWEVLEGGAEIALNSPGVNAAKEAGKGVLALGGHVASWFGDRISGGADGAVKAAETQARHGRSIVERTINQQKENAEEIGGALKQYGEGWLRSLNPFHGVSDAWASGDSIGSKVGGVAGKVIENGIVDTATNVANAANVAKEVGEAAVENAVTGVKNLGDAAAGGVEAVGNFIGGLFG
ncbi:MAG: hypothetical protein KDC46_03865 [Thermoleophilia bacterium]|nr:hypothetical protein [Thermoleophilia bacterium]